MSSEDLRRGLVDLIREHDLASDENTSPRDYRARLADAILPIVVAAVAAERERCAHVASAYIWGRMLGRVHDAFNASDGVAAAIRTPDPEPTVSGREDER